MPKNFVQSLTDEQLKLLLTLANAEIDRRRLNSTLDNITVEELKGRNRE